MPSDTLLNPFTRIAGFSALFYGCVIMLLTAAIAAPCGVNFVGSLNIHVAQPLPFELIFALLIFGWLTAATCFYIAGVFISQSNIRAVDVYGTFALARAPFLIAALGGLLPGLVNLDPLQKQMPMEVWVFAAVALLVDIWVVILSYNAFAVSTNVKSKWLFTAVFIVSEIIAIVMSGSLAVWILRNPVGRQPNNPAAVVVDLDKAPLPEDAEIVEIAKKFVERFFANTDDDPLKQFPAIEEMKTFVSVASFKHWSNKIITDYGKLGDCAKVEVVQHGQGLRSVYLFFHGERRPVKIWVTFDGTLIAGFHYDTWRESAGIPKEAGIVLMAVFSVVILPILLILMVVYGEKWRGRWIEAQNQDAEAFGVEQTFGTVYRESQNPLWMHLITLPIVAAACLPVFVVGPGEHLTMVTCGGSAVFIVLVMFLLAGIFIEVGEEAVDVKMGGMRYRLQRFPFDSITAVEVISFNPLWDFGGWGIKKGTIKTRGNVQGYFMSGTHGVLVQTDNGKNYLLGSDTPDRLAAVIRSRIAENQSADEIVSVNCAN